MYRLRDDDDYDEEQELLRRLRVYVPCRTCYALVRVMYFNLENHLYFGDPRPICPTCQAKEG